MSICRVRLAKFIHGKLFNRTVVTLILLNALTLGLETDPAIMAQYGVLLHRIDHVLLGFFVAELALRIYVLRGHFFRSGWNIFDFVIVGISLLPHIGPFSMLRTLRILRTFRLISTVPAMRMVVSALLRSIPGMASVMAILLVVFYVSAVMTTQIFGAVADPKMHALYGDIGNSMFTLFQLMTMDNWVNDVARPTLKHFPNAASFFVVFIVITSFSVLNLFIGIIVDAMNVLHERDTEAEKERLHNEHLQALKDIQSDINKILSKT